MKVKVLSAVSFKHRLKSGTVHVESKMKHVALNE